MPRKIKYNEKIVVDLFFSFIAKIVFANLFFFLTIIWLYQNNLQIMVKSSGFIGIELEAYLEQLLIAFTSFINTNIYNKYL